MLGTRRRDALVLCLLTAIAVSGCTYYPLGQAEEPSPDVASPTRHAAAHTVRLPVRQTVAPRNTKDVAPVTQIAGLVGSSERQVQQRFGVPAAREQHQPGTAWIYHDADCRLEVSFYPDVRTHDFKALGYEVKSDADTNTGKSRCTSRFASRVAAK
jgi:hypothetical protein